MLTHRRSAENWNEARARILWFSPHNHTVLSSSRCEEETSARTHHPWMEGTLPPFCISHGNAELMLREKGQKCENLSTLLAAAADACKPESGFFLTIHSDQISFRTKLKSKSSAYQKNIILNLSGTSFFSNEYHLLIVYLDQAFFMTTFWCFESSAIFLSLKNFLKLRDSI